MQSLYRDAVNAGRAGNIKYIRVPTPTHRKSSRIPRISPWDFGISSQWLDEQRSNPEVDVDGLLTDWGTHGNPGMDRHSYDRNGDGSWNNCGSAFRF
jgi:hypothetical protein